MPQFGTGLGPPDPLDENPTRPPSRYDRRVPIEQPAPTLARSDLRYGSLASLVQEAGRLYGTDEGLVDTESGRRWSFQELAADVRVAGRAFIAAGLRKGDRVAMWAPNISEWVIAAFGALSAGGVLVPLNTRFKGLEAAYLLEKSRATVLMCVNGFLGNDYVAALRAAEIELPALGRIVVLKGESPSETQSWSDFLAGAEAIDDTQIETRINELGADDLSDIIFTSGTTGRPKGAMTTHGQALRVFGDWDEVIGLQTGDRYLIVNPFFHTFGYKAGIVAALLVGATIIPQPVFDVSQVLQRVADERVSVLPGPPTLFQSILEAPNRDDYDLSSLRLCVTGAAAVPVELVRRMREELTFKTIVTGYGLTETTGVVSMCRHDDDPETISLTSGRAALDVEVRIVDDQGAEVRTGEPGEVWVRGHNVMKGYFEDAERTAEALTPDGWLKTGDIAIMDARGYLRITDRIKDMYIVGGFNAYPAEIEGVILRHPAIAQVAVVGIPDQRMGEVGCAFVVAREGAMIDAAEIIAWSREQMANYKVPRRVIEIDALPLNASGKVLKFELRARAAAI